MADYTPTTGDVEFAYIDRRGFHSFLSNDPEITDEESAAEFDRWLAAHDRAVKADLLRTMAGEADRKSAERAAISRENDVRCSDCNLRFGESDQYSCVIEGTGHRYFEDELTRAREDRIEPTYDGNQLRARADQIEGDKA